MSSETQRSPATIAVVMLLAVGTIWAVLIPSAGSSALLSSWPELAWARPIALVLINGGAIGAAVLSLVLSVLTVLGAAPLSVLLALMGLTLGLATADTASLGQTNSALPMLVDALLPCFLMLMGGAHLRFWRCFPHAIVESDLVRVFKREVQLPLGYEFPLATRLLDSSRESFNSRFPRISRGLRVVRRPMIWMDERLKAKAARPLSDDEAAQSARVLMRMGRWGWWIGGVAAVVTLGLGLADPKLTRVFGAIALFVFALLPGGMLANAGYTLADPPRRSQALWIIQGWSVAGLLITVGSGSVVALAWLFGLDVAYLGVALLVAAVSPVVFLTYTTVAVFWEGVFDPRLAIRRTTFYAILGSIGFVGFAVLENVVSELFESVLGLPSITGAALAGTVVAAVLIPLRTILVGVAARWFPDEIEAETPTP